MRAHLLQTLCDYEGNVLYGVTVQMSEASTYDVDGNPVSGGPLAAALWDGPDPNHSAETSTTQVLPDGILDVWLDEPQYVRLGVTPVGAAEQSIEGVAVLVPTTGGGGGGGLAPVAMATATFTSTEGPHLNSENHSGGPWVWVLEEFDPIATDTPWLAQDAGLLTFPSGIYSFEVVIGMTFANVEDAPAPIDARLVYPTPDGGDTVRFPMAVGTFAGYNFPARPGISQQVSIPPRLCEGQRIELWWESAGGSSVMLDEIVNGVGYDGDPASVTVHVTRWRDLAIPQT